MRDSLSIGEGLLLSLLFSAILWSGCVEVNSSQAGRRAQPHPAQEAMPVEKKESAETNDMFSNPPSIRELATGEATPPTPEELEVKLQESAEKWFYGRGLGRTMTNVAAIAVFPPYAIYLLGNAGLQLAGYDPIYITDALPGEGRETVLGVYDGITSVPGRVTSTIAGREFE